MGLFDGLGEQISGVFSPITDFFGYFKLFMLKVEIFFTNFAFVVLWALTMIVILMFITFPFWFPALMKKYKTKTIGKFLNSALTNLVGFFK